jgi:hypothetical protein
LAWFRVSGDTGGLIEGVQIASGIWPQLLLNQFRPGLSMVRGGLKDRARPAVRVLDPPRSAVGSCAAPFMAHSHLSRRSSLQSLGSQALVDLSDCCCFRSLPRLGELVDQILFERQVALPPLPLDPQVLEILPY